MNFEKQEVDKSISEVRMEKVREVVAEMQQAGVLKNIRALIVLGSTVRGDAREDSDIDLFCITKDGGALLGTDANIIGRMINEKLPGVEVSLVGGDKGIAARFVSRKNVNEKTPAWEILYSEGDAASLNDEIETTKLQR